MSSSETNPLFQVNLAWYSVQSLSRT